MEFLLEAKTDTWTGGAVENNQLRMTGIKGSLRWWTEALLRGLGAKVCDPTDDKGPPKRCMLDLEDPVKKQQAAFEKEVKEKICPGCYLFGCTGWSGKVGLRIREGKPSGPVKSTRIKKSKEDALVLELLPLKPLADIEQDILIAAIRLIVDYGSLGGRTTRKPSEVPGKNNMGYKGGIHVDYGILGRHLQNGVDISGLPTKPCLSSEAVDHYLADFKQTPSNPEWPDLRCFWFLHGAAIDRKTHNEIVMRDPNNPKKYLRNSPNFEAGFHDWLGGDLGAASKKIFSFAMVNRSWGYTKNDGKMFPCFLTISDNHGFTNIICGSEVIRNEL